VGGISRTNYVPYIEYVLSFLKNDKVQQPVIFPNIDENQNPWHMHIFNIHTNIQQNKRLLTQKLWEELAGQMCNIYYQLKGQNSSKRGQNGMKFYNSLEMLQNKFQLDIWKENKIIRLVENPERTDGKTDRHCRTIIRPV
jgi:hypothetical protein